MPFCAKCRDEFQGWVKSCPDCGVDLVTELPASDRKFRKARDPIVHIANALNEPIAMVWIDLLEKNGIRATTKGGAYRADGGGSDSPFLGCPIYVLQSDVERAREVLDGVQDDSSHWTRNRAVIQLSG